MGGCAIDATGKPLPEETIEACKAADAVLLGAVGGCKWDTLPGEPCVRRRGCWASVQPGTVRQPAPGQDLRPAEGACPLRPDIIGDSMDIMVVRELTGGIYFGKRGRETVNGMEAAYDTEYYTQRRSSALPGWLSTRPASVAKRYNVDKANVLESSRLWRETVLKVAKDYPDVELQHLYIDNAAMQLVRNPKQFDVILASNIFGDILSDEASQVAGSIGMLASLRWVRVSAGCMSLSMAPPRTSPARASPTLWPPSCPAPCCCAIL